MIDVKICKSCGREKSLDFFGKNKTYADGHDSKCKECRAVYYRQYAQKNADKKKDYRKRYYEENKDAIHIKQKEHIKPARSEEILGCTRDFFVKYLKQTWLDKYGEEWNGQPCHIDHIVPLAIAKTEEDIVRLCHYTNLRLLTPEDNMEKSDKLITKEEV